MLKSDRFGMEISYWIDKHVAMWLKIVKIRPFRYGNYCLYNWSSFNSFSISVKIRPFRYGNYCLYNWSSFNSFSISVKIRPFRYGNLSFLFKKKVVAVLLKSDRFGMEIIFTIAIHCRTGVF